MQSEFLFATNTYIFSPNTIFIYEIFFVKLARFQLTKMVNKMDRKSALTWNDFYINYMKNCNIWEGRQNNFLQAFDQQCKEIFSFILSKFFCEVQKSLQASFLLSVFLEKFLCNFSRNSYMNFCMLPEFKCKLFFIDWYLIKKARRIRVHFIKVI